MSESTTGDLDSLIQLKFLRKREINEQTQEMGYPLESILKEKCNKLPELQIKRKDFKPKSSKIDVDPEDEISIKPVIEDGVVRISLEESKRKDNQIPETIPEEVTPKELERYQDILPRTQELHSDNQHALLFRNDKSQPVGWVCYSETANHAFISFIGVSMQHESQNYGTSILNHLKSKFKSITLSPVAYPYKGQNQEDRYDRLIRFYIRNGFYFTDSGQLTFNKLWKNIETNKEKELVIDNNVVINGELFSKNRLLEIYLKKLEEKQVASEIFDNKEQELIKTWLSLRERYDELQEEINDLDLERYKQQIA